MPYKSKAQRDWAHTPAGIKALGGPDKVKVWDAASDGLKLPNLVKPTQNGTQKVGSDRQADHVIPGTKGPKYK